MLKNSYIFQTFIRLKKIDNITSKFFFKNIKNYKFYRLNVSIVPENLNKNPSQYYNTFNPRKSQVKSVKEKEWVNPKKPKIIYQLLKQGIDITINFWCMFPSIVSLLFFFKFNS